MIKMRILVVDNFDLMRLGVRTLLEERPEWRICGEAANGQEALEKVKSLAPDLVVLSATTPELDVSAVAREILQANPQIEILALCGASSGDEAPKLLAAGVRGLVLKSDGARNLVLAVEALSQRKSFLSPRVTELVVKRNVEMAQANYSAKQLTARQTEVLKLLAKGKSNKEVARLLRISEKTVESHRAQLMRKLELRSVVSLVHFAIRHKIVEI